VGRRSRAREQHGAPTAASSVYTDAHGNTLALRGSLTLGARREYAQTISGEASRAAATQEDAWQRAVEILFERLAVSWEIAGVRVERQRELLARLRVASPEERAWVRATLREHCAEHFPDVKAP
jgi:hypothetical protein